MIRYDYVHNKNRQIDLIEMEIIRAKSPARHKKPGGLERKILKLYWGGKILQLETLPKQLFIRAKQFSMEGRTFTKNGSENNSKLKN